SRTSSPGRGWCRPFSFPFLGLPVESSGHPLKSCDRDACSTLLIGQVPIEQQCVNVLRADVVRGLNVAHDSRNFPMGKVPGAEIATLALHRDTRAFCASSCTRASMSKSAGRYLTARWALWCRVRALLSALPLIVWVRAMVITPCVCGGGECATRRTRSPRATGKTLTPARKSRTIPSESDCLQP